jgi:hypothetical protein
MFAAGLGAADAVAAPARSRIVASRSTGRSREQRRSPGSASVVSVVICSLAEVAGFVATLGDRISSPGCDRQG